MPGDVTQDDHTGKLATPLGRDKLLLTRFEGAEGIGELFEFRIEALSPNPDVDFDKVLGLNSSVHLKTTDGAGRDFSGVLTQARWLGPRGRYYAYSLVLRPWLWLLSLTSDCRIFPNMDVKQIIKRVFESRNFGDIIDLTAGQYPQLEYTVQYRETDLNFVLRLMEEYGIYYYFQFTPDEGDSPSKHLLVLADSTTHVPLENPSKVIWVPPHEERRDVQQFNDWSKSRAMVSGVFSLKDYDYEKPTASLFVSKENSYHFTHSNLEMYNYPGGYNNQDIGKDLTRVSVEAERTRNQRWSASGYAPSLTPGFTITRTSVIPGDPENGDYLLLRCSHAYGYQTYESDSSAAAGAAYVGAYELARSDIPYRMPAHTRKPVIVGSQSALVVGKGEIDVDEDGRILVGFYWQREGKTSRRVRVAQVWAGAQRGALFLPRVGDEVMVQYEDGDPDRPIVVGSVYNGTQKNPANNISLKLPEKKTVTGLLGRSTNSNSTRQTANAWWFDDAKDEEVFVVRARKDLKVRVLNDESRHVSQNLKEVVDANVTQIVGGDETITVGGPKDGGNFTLNAVKKVTINVGPSKDAPLTQLVMDNDKITLSVGPGGQPTQISMDKQGITLKGLNIKINGVTLVTASAAMVKINS